jgi:hypothetical protein
MAAGLGDERGRGEGVDLPSPRCQTVALALRRRNMSLRPIIEFKGPSMGRWLRSRIGSGARTECAAAQLLRKLLRSLWTEAWRGSLAEGSPFPCAKKTHPWIAPRSPSPQSQVMVLRGVALESRGVVVYQTGNSRLHQPRSRPACRPVIGLPPPLSRHCHCPIMPAG